MMLPQTPVTVIQARLAAAEAAYHEVMLGGGVRTVVDQNGERIEFGPTNTAKLMAYIQSLRAQLGGATPGPMFVLM